MNFTNRNIKKIQGSLSSGRIKITSKIFVNIFKAVITLTVFATVIICCMGVGAVNGIIKTAPEITINDVTPSQYKTTVYDRNGIAIETLVASGANRIYVTIDEVPVNLQNAFIAIEDERFLEHNGIDAKGIIRAAYIGITNNLRFTQGASTITQQLIKNSVFSVENENSLGDRLKRKIQEQYLAVKLEQVADKSQILENYLNTINLGNNNLGVQSASLNYFNKDVSELTLSECAVIAAITQNPSKYNPIRHPDYNADRRKLVLDNMLSQKLITEKEYTEAINDDVYSRIANNHTSASSSSAYSYYTDALIQDIMEDLMTQKGYTYTQAYNLVYRGGLSIYSCEDSELQNYAQNVINNSDYWNGYAQYNITCRFRVKDNTGNISNYTESTLLKYLQSKYGSKFELLFSSTEEADRYIKEYKDYILAETQGTIIEGSETTTYTIQPQMSLVIIENGTGEVKVIIGGRGDKTESLVLNRAMSAKRQAGSTIKPLVAYAPAIDTAGYTLGKIYDDVPFVYETGQVVKNNDEIYKGFVTLRQAISESRNTPALRTLNDIGITTGTTYLKNFGITSLTNNDYYLPIALGSCSVTNFELTTAYTVFANNGELIKPKLYTKILDHDGNVILDNTDVSSTRVLKESTAWLMTNVLHSVLIDGTLHNLDVGDNYISAKSGTTQSNRDRWVVGYSKECTVGIWYGDDTNKTLDEKYGIPHVYIWADIIKKACENYECKEPEMPDSIVKVEICKDSGMLVAEGLCDHDERGSRVTTEYFVKGTEPTEYCNVHQKVTFCEETGKVATDGCPDTKTQVLIYKDFGNIDLDKYTIDDQEVSFTNNTVKDYCTKHHGTVIKPSKYTVKLPVEDDETKEHESEENSSEEDNTEEDTSEEESSE